MLLIVKKYQVTLTLLSVALAMMLGIITPSLFAKISFLGDLFINLLKLFALPLICTALIASLGEMQQGNKGQGLGHLKSLARNVVGYMLISEIFAVTIALILFNIFKPGVGLGPDLIQQGVGASSAIVGSSAGPSAESFTLGNFILSLFPHNIFASLAQFDLLPVVFFSIMFGVATSLTGEKAKPVIALASSARDISMTCLHGVMYLAPIGIFSLIGSGVASSYLSGHLGANLFALLNFVLVLTLGLFLHGLWQLFAVVFFTKQKPLDILKESLPVFTTAFGTSSSVATLPIAMECAQALKSSPSTTRFMLPLCASINVGGMMMYEVAAALFFSQMLGYDLSIGQQIVIAIACILGGMAEGGIPETSMVSLVVVFKIVNIPLSAISILLPLDRIIDRLRTMVNIFGNMCGAIVVSALTKEDTPHLKGENDYE